MKQLFLSFLICLLSASAFAQSDEIGQGLQPAEYRASTHDQRLSYIKRYSRTAIEEMDRAGIPASIKLAQAILESNAGQSTLAREANNHFGIKCHKDWKGKEYFKEDDDYVNGQLVKSCFRVYKRPEDSFEDHSSFLRDPKKYQRYGSLFDLNRTDYKSWAYGLQSAGYATSGTYAESLIRIIEDYQLHHYDTQRSNDSNLPPGTSLPTASTGDENPRNRRPGGRDTRNQGNRVGFTGKINDVKAVYAQSGMTIQTLSRRYGLSPNKVACYNDCQIPITQVLSENDIVYLAKKRKKYRGRQKTVIVQQGETMFTISQRYGIQLVKLYERNQMIGGTEPAEGEVIHLKGRKRSSAPKLREKTSQDRPGRPRPTAPDPSPYKPSDNELFELGGGGTTQPAEPPSTKPSNSPTTSTPSGRPATTGTSRPDTPTNTTTSAPTGGTPTTQPSTPPQRPGSMVESKPTPTEPPSTGTAANTSGFHTVVKGDTLYNISKRYNLTVEKLRAMNDLPSNDIKIGQILKVK